MISEDLFNAVLIEPARKYPNAKLQIISGYATGSMANFHIDKLRTEGLLSSIELIVGMSKHTGISVSEHKRLCDLVQNSDADIAFRCRYVVGDRPVHAKAYVWSDDSGPYTAFSGSANYTKTGFGFFQTEVMTLTNPHHVSDFYWRVFQETRDCQFSEIAKHVPLLDKPQVYNGAGAELVRLSLLTRAGETPSTSGINHGQRVGIHSTRTDRSAAYISVPATVSRAGFFPDRDVVFVVHTDDGLQFRFKRTQDGGKAMSIVNGYEELGRYLRTRMGVTIGEKVEPSHLQAYGRTDITFMKYDDGSYGMDFSV